MSNMLYYGDNLDVLRRHVDDGSVDLVYLDPPFKSNQDYNVLFEERDGSRSRSQSKAFEDTWTWDEEAADSYESIVEAGGHVADTMRAFRTLLGANDMLAYLSMMAPRLLELRRVLKNTGSIYLHCDVTASAYLRLLMDAVFDPRNFRNEIIWYYYNKMHDRRKKLFPRAHDTILFYVKDVAAAFTFHQLKEMRDEPVKQLMRKKVDGKMVNVKGEDGHVVYRLKADRTLDNVWRLPCLQPAAPERLGYQTQKPEALLERIVRASSNEGDLVLDPFCGCGTAVAVAQRLKRQWIGIDITHIAVNLIRNRLQDTHRGTGIESTYRVIGEPTTLMEAAELAATDKYQFQWWALGLVGARGTEEKKGGDRGIDGRLYFHDEPKGGKTKQIIFSVKGGKLSPTQLRDLIGTVTQEKAEIGVLLCMESPTKGMRSAAAAAGFYTSEHFGGKYPRIQILTIEEIFAGKKVEYPSAAQTNVTFRKAPKAKAETPETPSLF